MPRAPWTSAIVAALLLVPAATSITLGNATSPVVELGFEPSVGIDTELPGPSDPLVPNATDAPPVAGFGELDPWIDAHGDKMFGTLNMGNNVIQYSNGALDGSSTGQGLRFGGNRVCTANVAIAGCGGGGGDITGVLAGAGLAGGGTAGDVSLSVNTALIQNRVTGVCAPGSSMGTVNQDGTVACELDDDTTYTAGTGVSLTGTQFSVNPAAVQSRVTGTCGPEAAVKSVNQDGTVTCEPDTDTTYTAGTGLLLTGTSFSNTGDTNAADDLTTATAFGGDVTGTYNNLQLGTDVVGAAEIAAAAVGTSEVSDGALLFADLAANGCSAGHVIKLSGGLWTCGTDIDTDTNSGGTVTSVTGGTGLTGGTITSSGTLAVNTATIQARVTGACGPDASIKTVNADGTVLCEPDTDTTYTAGSGLVLTGTTFSNTGDTNAADDVLTTTVHGGDVTGTYDNLQLGVGSVGTGEIANGAVLFADLASNGCTANQVIKFVAGAWACAVDVDTDTDTLAGLSCADLSVARWYEAFTAWGCGGDQDLLGSLSCPDASIVKRVGGAWDCGVDVDTNSGGTVTSITGGTGLTGGTITSSGTLAVDTATIQARVTGACGPDASIKTISADGTVLCEPDTDTTYTAGAGLALAGTTFSNTGDTYPADDLVTATLFGGDVSGTYDAINIATAAVGTGEIADASILLADLGTNGCTGNQVMKRNAGNTAWVCAADVDTDTNSGGTVTNVASGAGLTGGPITGTGTLSLNINGGAAQTCTGTNKVTALGATGLVTCAADVDTNSGGTVTSVTAGSGLTGGTITSSGTIALATPTSTTLGGVTSAACAGTDKVTGVTTAGALTCSADAGTTYTGTSPIGVSGTVISLSTVGCVAGEVWKWDGAAWGCVADADTTYIAGTGLSLTGNTFSNAGDTNAADDVLTTTTHGGDVTGVYSNLQLGTGVVTTAEIALDTIAAADIAAGGVGTSEIANGAILFAHLGQNGCATDQGLKWSGTGWICTALSGAGTVTQVSAGLGLTGGPITTSGTLSIDTAVVPQLSATNTFVGEQTILTGGDNVVGLKVRANSPGQSVPLQTWIDGDGIGLAHVTTTGDFIGSSLSVQAWNTVGVSSLSSVSTGVYGDGPAMGVSGYAGGSTGIGVMGNAGSATGATIGVDGQSNSPAGTGVRGRSLATSGTTFGVYGSAASPAGYGLYTPDRAFVGGSLQAASFTGAGSALTALNAGNLATGTVTAARGGTGVDTSAAAAGSLLRRNSAGALWEVLVPGTAGQALKIAGGLPTWSADADTLGGLSCSEAQIAKFTTGAWVCGSDVDTDTDTDTLGALACAAGQVPKWGGASWACGADQDTTYSAGAGLTLNAGQFRLATTGCGSGRLVSGADVTGLACGVDRVAPARTLPSLNTITTVDAVGDVGSYASLTIGPDGLPVISYYDATGQDLKVAKCQDLPCSTSTATTVDGAISNAGRFSSIAIGTSGNPVISYNDGSRLRVALCGDPACANGNVLRDVDAPPAAVVGRFSSLAIGTDGKPVISYFDDTNFDLKVAHCGAADCSSGNVITVVDATAVSGLGTGIAIGIDGYPIIAYNGDGSLKVAKCVDIACANPPTITTLESAGVGEQIGITLNSDGRPIIAYYVPSSGDLKVVTCVPVDCVPTLYVQNHFAQPDGFGVDAGKYPSVVLGSDGHAIVAYQDVGTGDLKFAKCSDLTCEAIPSSSEWRLATVDASPNVVGAYASMALGADGLPIIAYYDGTAQDLKVIHFANEFGRSGLWRRG